MSNTKCPVCSTFFVSVHDLHVHCVQKHPQKYICCPICYVLVPKTKSNEELVKHSNLLHGRQTKTSGCRCVDFSPNKPYSLDDRMVKQNQCMACLKTFMDIWKAARHYKSVHLALKYLCHRCPSAYDAFDKLKRHHRHEHDNSAPKSPNKRMGKSPHLYGTGFAGFETHEKMMQDKQMDTRISPDIDGSYFAGFETHEEMTAESASSAIDNFLQSDSMERKPRKAKSSPTTGIRILDSRMDFQPYQKHNHLYLTYLNKNKRIKLKPLAMDDTSKFIDLSLSDETEILCN